MSTHDDREGVPSSQQNSHPKKRAPKAPRQVRPPIIEPGGIYSLTDLVINGRIDPGKFRDWGSRDEGGLYPIDMGTKEYFYSADECIAFWLAMPRLKLTVKPKTSRKPENK